MSRNAQPITESVVRDLLAIRHSKDVFVAGCKNGPTWSAVGLSILDAWAMKRSWARPCTWGYEIKVSRSDFIQDNKWPGYLPYCNQFYFVCPKDVIRLDEVPDQAGLVYVSTTATRLYTKKKAPHREGEPPIELLQYILFSRARIGDEYDIDSKQHNRAYWTKWLEQKTLDRDLGWRVGRALRETITRRVLAAEDTAKRQAAAIARLERVKAILKDLGLSPSYADSAAVRARAAMLRAAIPEDLMAKLGKAERALVDCQDSIRKHAAQARGGPHAQR